MEEGQSPTFPKCCLFLASKSLLFLRQFTLSPNFRGGGAALPDLTEDFHVCQMPEYDEKRKCTPRPQFCGTVGGGVTDVGFFSGAFPREI